MSGVEPTPTLHGPVLRACRRTPDAIALQPASRAGDDPRPGPDSLSYADLDDHSAAWAGALIGAGVGRGRFVAVCLPRGPDLIVGMLAVLRAGAAYVSTEPDHPPHRLRGILTDAEVPVLLATEEDGERLRATGALPDGCRVCAVSDLNSLAELDGLAGRTEVPLPEVAPDDAAYVIFTSGSTGRPKGSVISHRAIAGKLDWLARRCPLDGTDRVLQKISASFDFAVSEIFWPLGCGARLVLAEPGGHRDSGYLASVAARHRITVLHFVPSALEVFLLEPRARSLPALRLALVGGETLPPALVDRFRERSDAEFINMYGPSECSIFSTAWTCPDRPPYGPVTIGHPVPGVIAVVVDEDGDAVAPGVVGELFLGGAGVGEGYLGRPDLDARAFVADPTAQHPGRFYRTGDLVRATPDGELHFVGRVDNQIKIRGFRVELGEVTSALLEVLDVAQAAVLPAPGPAGGSTELHAFVVSGHGRQPLTGQPAAAALAGRLPDYMIPTRWSTVDHLPVTQNGKLDATALLQLADGAAPARPSPATTGSADQRIAELWRLATDLPADDPGANLFALGGNSLTAARLLAHLRAEFGLDLRLDEFAAEPTVAALTRALTQAGTRAGFGNSGDSGDSVEPDLADVRRPDPACAPLHPTQRRLWLLEKLLPGSPTYNIVTLHRLVGSLDVNALAAAVTDVVCRHEPLRTTLRSGTDGPQQVISAEPTVKLVVSELTGSVDEWASAIARTRFDIGAGPLLRVELATAAPDEHWLVLCLHHLVADGWSMGVFCDDLGRAYRRHVGERVDEPPLPVRYGDVAIWAAQRAGGPRAEADVEYWRHHLAGAPTEITLPWHQPATTATAPALRSRERVHRRHRPLTDELAGELAATARRERVTPAVLVLAAYTAALTRWSGQDEVVIGTPLAGRHHPLLDDVVGFFNSTVVLRARLAECRTGRDALRRLADELIAAQSHDTAPFDQVAAALGQGGPLFGVWFNVLNYTDHPLRLTGLQVDQLQAPLPGALFDLGLYAHTDAATPAIELVYDTDRLEAGHATALIDDVHAVLTDLIHDPGRPLSSIGAATPDRTPLPAGPASPRLIDTVDQRVAEQPAAVAVRAGDGEYSYAELAAADRRIAETLMAVGAGPGHVVAIQATASRDLVAAVLAVRRVGAAFTLLDPAHPAAWRKAQLELIRPVVSVELGADGARVVAVAGARQLTDHVQPVGSSPRSSTDRAPAYLMFTSGSTAAPRAVVGAEQPVTTFLQRYSERFELVSGDVFGLLSGYGHDPVLRDLLTPLWVGGRLEIPPSETRAEPARLLEWLVLAGVSVLHLTPVMADLLATAADATPGAGVTLPALRLACFGGDALSAATVRAWRALAPTAQLVNFYGCTETPQAATWHVLDAEPSVPIGAAGPSARLMLRRPDGAPATVGQRGEILVRTALPTLGYLDDPRATAARYLPDPAGEHGVVLVRTGDIGRMRPDGTVQVLGRCDDEVKVRGHRVSPRQIEAALADQGELRAAAVLSVPGAVGERLAACVVPAAPVDGTVTAESVRRRLRGQLPAALVPELVLLRDELPVTPNGKLDRHRLRAQILSEQEHAAPTARPILGNSTAATVRGVWQDVLGIGQLDDEANFFDLGGTSLTLLDAHARLIATPSLTAALSAVDLSVVALFEHPTVRSLTAYLDGLTGGTNGDAPRASRARTGPRAGERARRRAAHGVPP